MVTMGNYLIGNQFLIVGKIVNTQGYERTTSRIWKLGLYSGCGAVSLGVNTLQMIALSADPVGPCMRHSHYVFTSSHHCQRAIENFKLNESFVP